ncbi:MAG: MbnP family protein [Bacteroidia bacterium]
MNRFAIILLLFLSGLNWVQAKTVEVCLNPVFGNKKLTSGEKYFHSQSGDSLKIDELIFYISSLKFRFNDSIVFSPENDFHLISVRDSSSLKIIYTVPDQLEWNNIVFHLGIDSLTSTSGALGGALDPANGMYWAWQSGYINFKLEGTAARCPARNHRFQYHLGGYLYPNNALQEIKLNMPETNCIKLTFDTERFFDAVNIAEVHTIMSPGSKAVELSVLTAKLFYIKP